MPDDNHDVEVPITLYLRVKDSCDVTQGRANVRPWHDVERRWLCPLADGVRRCRENMGNVAIRERGDSLIL